jgi:hypothetical protein
MLNWIAGYVGRWAGVVDIHVRDLVHWAIHALASVIYTVFGHVGNAWGDLLAAFKWLHSHAADYVAWTIAHLRQIILVDLPKLAATALGYLKQALAFATTVYHLALAGIARLHDLARQWVADALQFVHDHVYAPLLALARQLRTDLLKWGYYAYQLVTHPDQLAVILLDALIAAAEAAFWRIADPAGRFALRLILSQPLRFARLAETIAAAVL